MAIATLNDLRQETVRLYQEQAFNEALELLDRHGDRFPEATGNLLQWQLCLANRAGKSDEALGYFRRAVEEGHWYSPSLLRSDPDLATLVGNPEFERLVEVCAERNAAAQAEAKPHRVTLEPETTSSQAPLLIAFHGNGGNAEEVEHWRPLTARGSRVSMIQSTQLMMPGQFIWNDREWATAEAERHYAELISQFGTDREQVVLGGFSAGAALSIWLTVSGVIPARGFIALGPWMANPEELRPLLEKRAPGDLRAYIIVGEKDEPCLKVSQAVQSLLAEYGFACELEVQPGIGHVYPENFAQRVEKALEFVLQR